MDLRENIEKGYENSRIGGATSEWIDAAIKLDLPLHEMHNAAETQTERIKKRSSLQNQIDYYEKRIAGLPDEVSLRREYEEGIKKWEKAGLSWKKENVEDVLKGIDMGLPLLRESLEEEILIRITMEKSASIGKLVGLKQELANLPDATEETTFKTGVPCVFRAYHTSPFGDFERFDEGMLGRFTGANSAEKAHFFSGRKETAETYAADEGWLLQHKGFFALKPEQRDELTAALKETESGIESSDEEIANLACCLFDLDGYDTEKVENKTHEVFVVMTNPYVFDYKGESYREVSYASILEKAITKGHDGVIFANTSDVGPAAHIDTNFISDNIFAVPPQSAGNIFNASDVKFDSMGKMVPLSKRFAPMREITMDYAKKRFLEITKDLGGKPEKEEVEQWKNNNPKDFQELEEMKQKILCMRGWDLGPVYQGFDKNEVNGELYVYGKNAKNSRINREKGEKNEFGFYFSSSEEEAKAYARNAEEPEVRKLFLKGNYLDLTKNNSYGPYGAAREVGEKVGIDLVEKFGEDLNGKQVWRLFQKLGEAERKEFIKAGCDGVIFTESSEFRGVSETVIVFDSANIKSANPLELDGEGRLIKPEMWGTMETPDIRDCPMQREYKSLDVSKFSNPQKSNHMI